MALGVLEGPFGSLEALRARVRLLQLKNAGLRGAEADWPRRAHPSRPPGARRSVTAGGAVPGHCEIIAQLLTSPLPRQKSSPSDGKRSLAAPECRNWPVPMPREAAERDGACKLEAERSRGELQALRSAEQEVEVLQRERLELRASESKALQEAAALVQERQSFEVHALREAEQAQELLATRWEVECLQRERTELRASEEYALQEAAAMVQEKQGLGSAALAARREAEQAQELLAMRKEVQCLRRERAELSASQDDAVQDAAARTHERQSFMSAVQTARRDAEQAQALLYSSERFGREESSEASAHGRARRDLQLGLDDAQYEAAALLRERRELREELMQERAASHRHGEQAEAHFRLQEQLAETQRQCDHWDTNLRATQSTNESLQRELAHLRQHAERSDGAIVGASRVEAELNHRRNEVQELLQAQKQERLWAGQLRQQNEQLAMDLQAVTATADSLRSEVLGTGAHVNSQHAECTELRLALQQERLDVQRLRGALASASRENQMLVSVTRPFTSDASHASLPSASRLQCPAEAREASRDEVLRGAEPRHARFSEVQRAPQEAWEAPSYAPREASETRGSTAAPRQAHEVPDARSDRQDPKESEVERERRASGLEKQLMLLNSERQLLDSTLMKFPSNSSGRNLAERRQKRDAEQRMEEVDRTISQLRQELRRLDHHVLR